MSEPSRAEILLVDDSAARLTLLQRLVEGAGYRTRCATSGEQCLRLVRRDRPDLLLLDVVLPDLSGVAVCRRLRREPAFDSMPVLLFSAAAITSEAQAEGLEAGADGYLTWPLSARELRARLALALRHNRPQRRAREERLTPRQREVLSWIEIVSKLLNEGKGCESDRHVPTDCA